MEDYNKVLEATQVSENASGTAAEKMTIYNDSLTAAQNRLTAAIQEFAENSNVSQLMITGIDLLTKIIQLLDLLLNKIPLISPLLRTVGTAFIVAFGTNAVSSIISTSTQRCCKCNNYFWWSLNACIPWNCCCYWRCSWCW